MYSGVARLEPMTVHVACRAEQLVELSAPAFSDDGIPSDAGLREAMQYKLEAGGESSSVTAEQIVAWDLLRQTNDDLAELELVLYYKA